VRTCVACRTRRDKAALVRVVRRPDGTVVLDHTGDFEGRGAYLCADRACAASALKRSALERALRTPLPTELKTRLEHGDVVAIRVTTDHGAPAANTGGTHGT
jgi:predicted RNA-binding protein YlxR (DUF448 family)